MEENYHVLTEHDYLCAIGAMNPESDESLIFLQSGENPEEKYLKEEAFFSLSEKAKELIRQIFNPTTKDFKKIVKCFLNGESKKKEALEKIRKLSKKIGVYSEIKQFVDSKDFNIPAKAGFSTSRAKRKAMKEWWKLEIKYK